MIPENGTVRLVQHHRVWIRVFSMPRLGRLRFSWKHRLLAPCCLGPGHGSPGGARRMRMAAADVCGSVVRMVAPWILSCNFLLCSSPMYLGTIPKGVVRLEDGLEFCSSLQYLIILISCPRC